jgi:hypothetical protein
MPATGCFCALERSRAWPAYTASVEVVRPLKLDRQAYRAPVSGGRAKAMR